MIYKQKGDYGRIRFERMIARKRKRWERRKMNYEYNRSYRTWIGDDGLLWQKCDWQGDCHYPCNGDC